ncbi:hypothetical protein ABIB50_005190 [Mucilaginibacter sp. UYCu711]
MHGDNLLVQADDPDSGLYQFVDPGVPGSHGGTITLQQLA